MKVRFLLDEFPFGGRDFYIPCEIFPGRNKSCIILLCGWSLSVTGEILPSSVQSDTYICTLYSSRTPENLTPRCIFETSPEKNPENRAKVTLSGRSLQHHPCRRNLHKPSFYISIFHNIMHDYSLSRLRSDHHCLSLGGLMMFLTPTIQTISLGILNKPSSIVSLTPEGQHSFCRGAIPNSPQRISSQGAMNFHPRLSSCAEKLQTFRLRTV